MRLIDADALILRVNDNEFYSDKLKRVLCSIVDAAPTVEPASPWRMVEEPPKEEHRTYLVYTDTGYMCSCRWTNNVYGLGESDRWGWCLADVPQFQKVAYWMPIEPPKEE